MGRKKINKDSIEYISRNLFYKPNFVGFQFTAGRTPRAILNNEDYTFGCSLNFDETKGSTVIDGTEMRLEELIFKKIFPDKQQYSEITKEELASLREKWINLNYEYDYTDEYAGEWHWFRIKCSIDDLPNIVKSINL